MIAILASDLQRLFELPAVQRAAVGLLIGGVFLPLVGVLIVGLDIFTVRFAVMHVALLGIAVGLWIGVSPTTLGLVCCAVTGAAVAPLAGRPGGLAGPMGFVMTLSIALALLVLSISGVNANGAFGLLWGSIFAVRPVDLVVLAVLAVVVLAVIARWHRAIALLLFDREIAACSGVRVGALTMLTLVLVSVSIGASVRLTGALLVDALTILPALTARALTNSLRAMFITAVLVGVAGNTIGLLVALELDQPPGPVLVLVSGALTIVSYMKKGFTNVPSFH